MNGFSAILFNPSVGAIPRDVECVRAVGGLERGQQLELGDVAGGRRGEDCSVVELCEQTYRAWVEISPDEVSD